MFTAGGHWWTIVSAFVPSWSTPHKPSDSSTSIVANAISLRFTFHFLPVLVLSGSQSHQKGNEETSNDIHFCCCFSLWWLNLSVRLFQILSPFYTFPSRFFSNYIIRAKVRELPPQFRHVNSWSRGLKSLISHNMIAARDPKIFFLCFYAFLELLTPVFYALSNSITFRVFGLDKGKNKA